MNVDPFKYVVVLFTVSFPIFITDVDVLPVAMFTVPDLFVSVAIFIAPVDCPIPYSIIPTVVVPNKEAVAPVDVVAIVSVFVELIVVVPASVVVVLLLLPIVITVDELAPEAILTLLLNLSHCGYLY